MSYELVHNTTRRAPKVTFPALAKAYGKLPKEDEQMSKTDTSDADCGHVLNVSATERLRELLDERGVRWIEWKDPNTTAWFDGSNAVRADEYDGHSELLVERVMTPEQAIDATLGAGACHTGSMAFYTPEQAIARVWLTCGHDCVVETLSSLPNYCPVCGKKVVHE